MAKAKKLTKVVFEYDDGSKTIIEGKKNCDKWWTHITRACSLADVQGFGSQFEDVKFKFVKPKKEVNK